MPCGGHPAHRATLAERASAHPCPEPSHEPWPGTRPEASPASGPRLRAGGPRGFRRCSPRREFATRSSGRSAPTCTRNRPRTTEDIDFLVGDEAFERHAGGFVTMRVPVVEFDGINVDQVPLSESATCCGERSEPSPSSDGVPIAPVETIVIMKLLAGRTQDLGGRRGHHRLGSRPRATERGGSSIDTRLRSHTGEALR